MSGSISASPLHQQHQQQNPSHVAGSNGIAAISATSRLQLQNLKAVAQNYGLDANSIGWAMIEEIIGVGNDHTHSQLHAAAWAEIWNVITTGKATLLLPTDQYQSNFHEAITPEFVKDHIVFCCGPSRDQAPIVTLSGLRGQIDENSLTIQSTLPISSKSFKLLSDPNTRASTLLSLPPLPALPQSPSTTPISSGSTSSLNLPIGYPRVQAYRYIPALPLPPRSSQQQKPPLPPRPGASSGAKALSASPNVSVSRLSNPFASFFGSRSSSTPTPLTSSPISNAIPLSGSHPLDSTSTSTEKTPEKPGDGEKEKDHTVEISAFTIAHPIIRKDIIRGIGKCLKSQIQVSLSDPDIEPRLPNWVIDRTQEFCKSLLPPSNSITRKLGDVAKDSDRNSILSVMSLFDEEDLSEVVQAFQNFYESLEDDLKRKIEDDKRKERERGKEGHKSPNDEEKEMLDKEKTEREKRIQGILERVEQVLTSLFYDRLFRPSNSDDASHDEALSSRIAALNMLDLSLDHLGVDAGKSAEDVNHVVEACGETITQLEVARSPADKAAILVAAHRIIVDGLSRLPPLRLKGEEEQGEMIDDEKTPQAPSFDKEVHTALENLDPGKERNRSDSPPKLTVSPNYEKADPITESSTSDTIKPTTDSSAQDSPPASPVPSFTLSPAGEEVPVPLTVPDDTPEKSLLTVSPPATQTPTPVSGDILLPLLIFSVVKANPPMLPSHLLYTQRYRNPMYAGVFGGEESYCLINLMAVIEFLENVDLEALGLGGGEKVISTADLSPIPVPKDISAASTPGGPAGLRGRVEQQVDAIAGSANKVLSGVVGSGFGVLRALLPGDTSAGLGTGTGAVAGESEGSAPWNIRPGFGLLRRESGFSIASLAASLPGRERARSFASSYHGAGAEEGQEMVESRPGSVHNMALSDAEYADENEEEDEEEEGEEESEEEEQEVYSHGHDARSIRSFESMMSDKSRDRPRSRSRGRLTVEIGGSSVNKKRMSLTDRLASMSRLTKGSGGALTYEVVGSPSQEPSTSPARAPNPLVSTNRFDTPLSSRTSSPVPGSMPASRPAILQASSSPSTHISALPKPNRRFLECSADDLKMSEIPELLAEYRKLVESARSLGILDNDEH